MKTFDFNRVNALEISSAYLFFSLLIILLSELKEDDSGDRSKSNSIVSQQSGGISTGSHSSSNCSLPTNSENELYYNKRPVPTRRQSSSNVSSRLTPSVSSVDLNMTVDSCAHFQPTIHMHMMFTDFFYLYFVRIPRRASIVLKWLIISQRFVQHRL